MSPCSLKVKSEVCYSQRYIDEALGRGKLYKYRWKYSLYHSTSITIKKKWKLQSTTQHNIPHYLASFWIWLHVLVSLILPSHGRFLSDSLSMFAFYSLIEIYSMIKSCWKEMFIFCSSTFPTKPLRVYPIICSYMKSHVDFTALCSPELSSISYAWGNLAKQDWN